LRLAAEEKQKEAQFDADFQKLIYTTIIPAMEKVETFVESMKAALIKQKNYLITNKGLNKLCRHL